MKFSFALLPLAAALGFSKAGPVITDDLTALAPVPVTRLVCDGNNFRCTATLAFGDGRWVAQWATAVFHHGLFGYPTEEEITSMAPVPVTKLVCDGNTHKCTANLHFADGRWVAQWSARVFHQGRGKHALIDAMAPVPVRKLKCDGNTYKCTANLDFGDGHWVAEWETAVFHQNL